MCLTLAPTPGLSNQLLATCAMVVFGNTADGRFYPYDWAWGEIWPPDPIADEAGAACTWHAMAEAAQFQFALTPPSGHLFFRLAKP